ncbi:E3 ubiquitin-protein ligase upl5 [Phtheirospermum japonicum]|uniref:HECT-type E3 ubiquitin transferase n=1 Tax=Phtheirospermum japonicum TaxID=374723 RepID=A0A830CHI8_9LAMI|nr:E3 ubiquitin-protein ligase upl5 [Phtheirospermum japonicum]
MGTRKVVELCLDGKSVVVNSKNKRQYVDSLIQHRFVKEAAEQVEHFAKGFGNILSCRELQKSFFRCLNPEDLDLMLHGSENEISVDDWKAHTESTMDSKLLMFRYSGFIRYVTGFLSFIFLSFFLNTKYINMWFYCAN